MANVIKLKRGSGSDPSASDLVIGEVAVRTDTGKLFTKKDNGTIAEISGAGGSDIFINTLSSSSGSGGGSATFNGTATRFTLSNPPDVSAQQLLVSVNGVVQKPNSGTNPSTGFAVDGNDIIFAAAPETGASFFIVTYGSIGLGIPADNSVTSAKIVDGTIVNADVNASAAIAGSKINPNFGSQDISTTGNLTLYGTNPTISFTDSNEDSDFRLFINAGKFKIQDASNSNADRFTVFTDGHIDIPGNLNCASGLDVTGEITSTSHLDMPDDAKIKLGTGDDLQIFHDGTQSVIENYTGHIVIRGNRDDDDGGNIYIQAKVNENSILCNDDGSVDLFHDGTKKLETTSSGIDITGNLHVDDLPDTTTNSYLKIAIQDSDGTLKSDDSIKINPAQNALLVNGLFINSSTVRPSGNGPLTLTTANGSGTVDFLVKHTHNESNGDLLPATDSTDDLGSSSTRWANVYSDAIDVAGNITISGTVDGVDIATRDTLFGGLTSSSGVLTDGVAATTQGASDNTTKVATTAYVTTAISNLINGAPSALDTLNELAAAMNDDAAFSATVTNSLATKMPLAGGTFTGDVTFDGATSGRDIIFDRSDNSLGFGDNTKIRIGNSQDLEIYHDGTDSFITNGTGELFIKTTTKFNLRSSTNETMISATPDGAVTLHHNNINKLETTSDGILTQGTILHKGAEGGESQIRMEADEGDDLADRWRLVAKTDGTFQLQNLASSTYETNISATGNGNVELYYNNGKQLETRSNGIALDNNLFMIDSKPIYIGNSLDMQLYHNGTNSIISNSTGALKLLLNNDEDAIVANQNGAVELYYDNSKKLETLTDGVNVTGTLKVNGSAFTGGIASVVAASSPQLGGTLDANGNNIEIDDGNFLKFGGTGLTIRTNANNAYITEGTSGKLLISATNLELANADSSKTYAYFTNGGSAQLYHNNSSKLETATYGLNLKDQLIQDCYSINSGGNQFRMIVPTGTSGGFRVLAHYADGSAAFNDSIANFYTTGIEFTKDITAARDINPYANNDYDLGTASLRWRNIYTNDLNLSNEGGANDVDGTWGSYTIQEGAEDLFLVNKRNGKKYKFNLTEVS